FFTLLFGAGLVILTGILVFIVFLGLFGVKTNDVFNFKEKPQTTWALVLLLAFIGILIFIGAGGPGLLPLPEDVGGFGAGDIAGIIFFLIVMVLAVWFLGKEGGKKE
ncbi:MAG: hypothetical protein HY367_04380, partial [Candidatus Aenigmarchaeota archaeon]|nr:hypothetical protein [Candidatus Aenigmarchaeota archaeon]